MKLIGKIFAPEFEDPERMAKRKESQKRLASLKAIQHTQESIVSRIRSANERRAQAESQYQNAIAPAEKELAECEALVSECILSDKPIPEDINARQDAANEIIEKAKARRQLELEGIDRVVKQLENQRRSHSVEQEIARIRGELSGPFANPQYLLERFVCDQVVNAHDKRIKAAKEELEFCKNAVQVQRCENEDKKLPEDSVAHFAKLEFEVRKWEAELTAAQLDHEEAVRLRQIVRDKILAE